MPWDIVTTSNSEADPTTAHIRRKLTAFIAGNWEKLDTVAASWRRSRNWIPCPFSIAMPDDPKKRKLTTAEEGAEVLLSRVLPYAKEQDAREVRFEGFGTSASGDSELRLFHFSCRPFEDAEEEGGKAPAEKLSNVAIDAANVLKDMVTRLDSHLEKHHVRELALLDKMLAMADKNRESAETIIGGMKIEREMRQDAQEHEARMANDREHNASIDKLIGVMGPPISNLLATLLAKKLGLDGKAFSGSFAARLTEIMRHVHDSADGATKFAKLEAALGTDAWDVLKAMSKAGSDEAFKALGGKFLEALGGDAKSRMEKVAGIVGQNVAMALLKLISDAGLL